METPPENKAGAALPVVTPPLNLPVGSVRALLTLAILGTVWTQLLRSIEIGEVLKDTLLLVLGYYFGARGAQKVALADSLAAPASREENPKDPLYLPRGSIRVLIVLGFAAVAWKLHGMNKLLGPHGAPPILVLVGMFIAGGVIKGMIGWTGQLMGGWVLSTIGHTLALATLVVVFGYCGAVILVLENKLPTFMEPLFLGIVGFYLGKR